ERKQDDGQSEGASGHRREGSTRATPAGRATRRGARLLFICGSSLCARGFSREPLEANQKQTPSPSTKGAKARAFPESRIPIPDSRFPIPDSRTQPWIGRWLRTDITTPNPASNDTAAVPP